MRRTHHRRRLGRATRLALAGALWVLLAFAAPAAALEQKLTAADGVE
jgi:hypothetical protein